MRAILVAAWLGGCSYTSPGALTDPPRDTLRADGFDVDASIDAAPSATCLAAATQTSPAGHHYFLTANASWNGSRDACAAVGGRLVKIEDATEDNFLRLQFGLDGSSASGFAWIGLSDPTSTDVYVWTDLTPLVTFNSFPAQIPPTSSLDCVDSGGGSWTVFNCTFANHGGVCECE